MRILNQQPHMMLGVPYPNKMSYFVIQYGHTMRWSEKTIDVKRAAHYCFGLSESHMLAWNLGSNLFEARKIFKTLKDPKDYRPIIEGILAGLNK